jgi:ribosomal protein S27AE
MVKWRPKSCPRCGGDIFIDRDLDNWYEQCLQCSYRVELKTLDGFQEPVSTKETCSKKRDDNVK